MRLPNVLRLCLLAGATVIAPAQPRFPMPIEFQNSAEFGWLNKKVLDSRLLDDMSDPKTWTVTGQAKATWPKPAGAVPMRALRVDMELFGDPPSSRNGLATVNVKRTVPNEDWSRYNRISVWVRPEISGLPMLPIGVVLRNQNRPAETHYVTLQDRKWQHVVWEIAPLARDKVAAL